MEENFDKVFKEVPGGYYDEYGFYINPDNSFFDPDKIYFNSQGFDKHGGFYDSNLEYQPGPGWIPDLMCYEDERYKNINNDEGNEDNDDDVLEDIYTNNKGFNDIMKQINSDNDFINKYNNKEDVIYREIPENKKINNNNNSNNNIVSEQKLELDSLFK